MAAGRLAHRLADEGDRSDEITDHLRACRAGKIGPSPGAGQQADQGRTAGQGSPEIHLEGLEVRDDLVRDFMALYLNTALLYKGQDRKSVVEGKSVSVLVDHGGGRFIKKKNK